MILDDLALHVYTTWQHSTAIRAAKLASHEPHKERRIFPYGVKATRHDDLKILAYLFEFSIPCPRSLGKLRLAQYRLEQWVGFVSCVSLYRYWWLMTELSAED
jgi:hypothetical protein